MISDISAWAREFVLELLDGFEHTDLAEFLDEKGTNADYWTTFEAVSQEVSRMLADLRKSVSGGAE